MEHGVLTLSEVTGLIEGLYPPNLAEGWDTVGLITGDPRQPVRRVLLAVDPVAAVVDEAIELGVDLVVTHHPLFLRPVHSVAADTYKGDLIYRLTRAGIALYNAHTNADSAPNGVADALAELIGVRRRRPLVAASPISDDERGAVGIGRVGELDEAVSLGDFTASIARLIPTTTGGVKVAGDLAGLVRRVAVVGGAGDSLFDAVRSAGADVYVTADLRHHPASELRERAEFEARLTGGPAVPYLINLSHFASEWPWLEYLARDLGRAADAAVAKRGN
ncbi:MAG: Nif3-like dinuclear metal center hexameric protein, partial [Promicromonosporaceae bacterium]|nr:Nif3-like dinuclear metal center hexameric protein [Promicromonosporaceae bacterium]